MLIFDRADLVAGAAERRGVRQRRVDLAGHAGAAAASGSRRSGRGRPSRRRGRRCARRPGRRSGRRSSGCSAAPGGRVASARTSVRPLSSRTRWKLLRAVAGGDAGPDRGVRVHPLGGRASAAAAGGRPRGPARSGSPSRSPSPRSASRAASGTSGRCPPTRRRTSVPVSATAKLAPLMPTLASRNSLPQVAPGGGGQRARVVGQVVGRVVELARRKSSRISARFLWIAGTRMCDGRSSPSWMISSARSVSIAWMPRAASASFRPDLLGGQRLDLDDLVGAGRRDEPGHDRVGLGGVARPVDVAARPGSTFASSWSR